MPEEMVGKNLTSWSKSNAGLFSDASSVQLGRYHEYEKAIHTQATHLKLQACATGNERVLSLAILWIHSVSLVSVLG
jgi:hypothetical protein